MKYETDDEKKFISKKQFSGKINKENIFGIENNTKISGNENYEKNINELKNENNANIKKYLNIILIFIVIFLSILLLFLIIKNTKLLNNTNNLNLKDNNSIYLNSQNTINSSNILESSSLNSLDLSNNKNLSNLYKSQNYPPIENDIAICCIGKKENLYINEFVDYYRNLGVKKIFLYDNNDSNDEKFESKIQKEIDEGFVKVINYRDVKTAQMKAYQDCYDKNRNDYEWLMFFDIDEFLYITNNKTLKEFLSDQKFAHCETIKINWINIGDNNLLYYDNRTLNERFKYPIEKHNIIKSIIRGKTNVNFIWSNEEHVHDPGNYTYACNPNGTKIKAQEMFNNEINYDYAYIKHFWSKSTEEYTIKRLKGRATVLPTKDWVIETIYYYFGINELTLEKIEYFESKLNHTFNDLRNQLLLKQKNK